MLAFTLNITVGVYLFISVFKIRSFLVREGIKQERINVKIMVLHTITFGLYLLAIFGFVLATIYFVLTNMTMADASPTYFISITIVCIVSFISQAIFSLILY